jgi:uncharacterized damage-inducible protein DinB
MSEIERTKPPFAGTEAEIILGYLDYHRDTLRLKAEGLDATQLGQSLAPSSMTLGGMVKHLAYVEDWWFNQVFAGNPEPEPWASVDWDADNDWDWHSAIEDSPEELRRLLDEAVAASDRIVAEALAAPERLEALSVIGSHSRPDAKFSLRYIVLHMIEEYARHNGHADLIRESVDGQVGD